jgi:spore maturation protein CgeB
MPTLPRPIRPRLVDETGQVRTLSTDLGAFDPFGQGSQPIFLGLGPDPALAAQLVPAGSPVAYLECPAFAAAMPADWSKAIPEYFQSIGPEALTPERVARSRFFLYRQNPRLYPSFWGRVLARIRLAALPAPSKHGTRKGPVLLVRPEAGLLEPELARALLALDLAVVDLPTETTPTDLARVLSGTGPSVFLCVNGAGLDADGLDFALLAEAGVPVALWCVDNPFHIISRFRAPFWKKLHLFVTDDWFLEPLRALGAVSAHHLPLAASRHFFEAAPVSSPKAEAVFVGRSAFPDRDGFFAGCRPPDDLAALAQDMLGRGERPDFAWWATRLDIAPLWPGKAVRRAGYGAEAANLAWRGACLDALAAAMPLTVYGDAGWRDLLPGVNLHGPVDYYRALAGLYAGAAVTVNLTSLLLPRGLTQRHFDVWAAGGCLVSDATPGLDLFPAELTRPMVFSRPEDAPRLAKVLAGDADARAALSAAWRALLAARHTYEKRLELLLDVVSTASCP